MGPPGKCVLLVQAPCRRCYWTRRGMVSAGFSSSVGCWACGAGAGLLMVPSRALRLASMRMCEYRASIWRETWPAMSMMVWSPARFRPVPLPGWARIALQRPPARGNGSDRSPVVVRGHGFDEIASIVQKVQNSSWPMVLLKSCTCRFISSNTNWTA